jgi:hypothetical protein
MRSTLFYTYIDVTKDRRIFYVGKGTVKRFLDRTRNRKHSAISAKYGAERVVVFIGSESRALAEEIRLIADLHTYIQDPECSIGCNFTRGGDGISGLKMPPEVVARVAAAHRGTKASAATRMKMSLSQRCRRSTPESNAKRSAALMGHAVSAETRARAAKTKLERKRPATPEHCAKLSLKIRAYLDGLTIEQRRDRMSKALAARKARRDGR